MTHTAITPAAKAMAGISNYAQIMTTAWEQALENGISREIADPLLEMHLSRIGEDKFRICAHCGGMIPDAVFVKNPFATVCKDNCATQLLIASGKVINVNGFLFHALDNAVEAQVTSEVVIKPFTGRMIHITGIEVKAMSPSMMNGETLFLFSLADGQSHNTLRIRLLANPEKAMDKLRLNFPHRDLHLLC